ncbi:MAG: hypothetical protein H7338_10120, partial [Candidatus Sericytochromatia bacterium]|nr:hypothetical protein [Candidatus Sericytochromatia bacterium]
MSFTIAGHTFFAGATAASSTTPPTKPPKEKSSEKFGDLWAGLKDSLGMGGINKAARLAFIKFDTNKADGLEAAEIGTIGA